MITLVLLLYNRFEKSDHIRITFVKIGARNVITIVLLLYNRIKECDHSRITFVK